MVNCPWFLRMCPKRSRESFFFIRCMSRSAGFTRHSFLTGGTHPLFEREREAAAGRDVRIGGGANAIHQYLHEGLEDDLQIAIPPVLLGHGERLFERVDWRAPSYKNVETAASAKATHFVLRRQGPADD